ncbi:MAG TPA: glycosyltransferase family 39 protein, partial [Tepidisphaeraceae bacterium]|nr:glycosyltransferase family 39 protein [Tepidisphaeraceae bacterium]
MSNQPIDVPYVAPVDESARRARDEPLRRFPIERPVESWSSRSLGLLVGLLITIGFAYLLLGFFWAPAHPGVDQNGYFVGGKQYAHTLSMAFKPPDDFGFVGRMWVMMPDGTNYPKYPLGLPILFAICLWIGGSAQGDFGYTLATMISPISSALTLLGVFLLTRRLANSFAGVVAMLLVGFGQVFITLSINPNSHAAAVCFVTWGVYFLIAWLQSGGLWRGMLGAFLLGFATLIRYTDGLLIIPLACAMLFAARWYRPRWFVPVASIVIAAGLLFASIYLFKLNIGVTDNFISISLGCLALALLVAQFIWPASLWRLLLVGGAWLLPVTYQIAFNYITMGMLTGYDTTNESEGFSGEFFRANWELMVRTLHDQGLFFVFPLGVIGLLMMLGRRSREAILLWGWILPSILLYTAYYWTGGGTGVGYARFVLTQLPPVVIGAAWLLSVGVRGLNAANRGATSRFSLQPTLQSNDIERIWSFRGAWQAVVCGIVVITASGMTAYRASRGYENGIQNSYSLEATHRSNTNLARLSELAIEKIPAGSTVFAEGDRLLNFLQFTGDWNCYSSEAFNARSARRVLWRSEDDPNEPDPIQPARRDFL